MWFHYFLQGSELFLGEGKRFHCCLSCECRFLKLLMFRVVIWGTRELWGTLEKKIDPPLKTIKNYPRQIWTFRGFPCVKEIFLSLRSSSFAG